MVGRMIGTVGLVYALVLCKHKAKVSFNEIIFIWFAGMIRGAIAFGLVLKIDESDNRSVVVTTSLALVIFTTVVFGSLMPLISKVLFK